MAVMEMDWVTSGKWDDMSALSTFGFGIGRRNV